jgi:hemolysin D
VRMSSPPVASPTLRYTAWVLLVLCFTMVFGSWVVKTEIVARGNGRVVAPGRTQTIQPQFPGQIAEISVADGASVNAGDVLLRMDATQANSDTLKLSGSLDKARRQLALHETILKALSEGDPVDANFVFKGQKILNAKFSSGLLHIDDMSFLEDLMKAIAANAGEFDFQIQQVKFSIATADTKLNRSLQDRALLQERVAKKSSVPKTAYLEIKREVASADYEVKIAANQRQELEAQLKTIQQSRTRYLASLRADHQQKVADLKFAFGTMSAELHAAKNRQFNTSITAPVSGRIENLQVFTQGGYVQAGQTLMSVVPNGQGLEIESLFQNRDSGFLEVGQTVLIKLDAYPAERFGILKGRVLSVGADARKDETTKAWVYAVQISPDHTFVERDGKRYHIAPGMTGTTDVVLGDRRLISYFFEPVIKAMQDGLREQ